MLRRHRTVFFHRIRFRGRWYPFRWDQSDRNTVARTAVSDIQVAGGENRAGRDADKTVADFESDFCSGFDDNFSVTEVMGLLPAFRYQVLIRAGVLFPFDMQRDIPR